MKPINRKIKTKKIVVNEAEIIIDKRIHRPGKKKRSSFRSIWYRPGALYWTMEKIYFSGAKRFWGVTAERVGEIKKEIRQLQREKKSRRLKRKTSKVHYFSRGR